MSRRTASLGDTRRFAQQNRRGRSLDFKGKALIRINRNDNRQRHSVFNVLGLGIERLAEFHDVEAMLTERGSDRRTWICSTRGYLQLDVVIELLSHFSYLPGTSRLVKLTLPIVDTVLKRLCSRVRPWKIAKNAHLLAGKLGFFGSFRLVFASLVTL